jgi:hypothetical protein
MSNAGLLYVGAILFINGMALMGFVKGTGATPLNWFVGFLQVVTPTYLIFTADGNTDQIFNAAGLYLFGFTYLYVALNNTWGHSATGLGYYSLFVAVVAAGYAVWNLVHFGDVPFFVIWLQWGFLWFLFFVLMGLGKDIAWFTGGVAAVQGWITGTIPAFLSLTGLWGEINQAGLAIFEAVVGIAAICYFAATNKKHQTVAA